MNTDLSKIMYEIEEFLYQLFTWLALFPKTLVKGFFRPSWIQAYVGEEIEQALEERFAEFLNPLIFWFLSILVIMWSATTSAEEAGSTLAEFLFMLVLFAVFPIIFAAIMLRARHVPLSHNCFQRPLYTQMVVFGVFQTVMGISLAGMAPLFEISWASPEVSPLGVLLIIAQFLILILTMLLLVVPFLWLFIAEIVVLKQELETKWYKVLGWVFLGLITIGLFLFGINILSAELDILRSMINIE